MKTIVDPTHALARGLAAIRTQFHIPESFPPAVLAEAEIAAKRAPNQHSDRTDMPFVTLDPASSTDLDQAFAIDRDGQDLLLHYAIADVAWFVDDGGAIDQEAWIRGASQYLPDGKAPLYPPILSEQAASLLPDGPRPAVIFTVRVATDGCVRLDRAERASSAAAPSWPMTACGKVTCPPISPSFRSALRLRMIGAARHASTRPSRKCVDSILAISN